MEKIHENARVFNWKGEKEIAFLLIHGFTGSPAEMRHLGIFLRDKGYTVSSVLLPGHGTVPEDMQDISWQDWYKTAEDELHKLQAGYKMVIPIGLSMGGLLALYLAARGQASAVISLNTPIYLQNWRSKFAFIIKRVKKYHGRPMGEKEWQARLQQGEFFYPRFPTQSYEQFQQLRSQVKKELRNISVPTLVMQALDDGTVKPQSADYIFEHLESKEKKLVWLDKGGHIMTLSAQRDEVFAGIETWLKTLQGSEYIAISQ